MTVFIGAAANARIWSGSISLRATVDAPDQIGINVTANTTIACQLARFSCIFSTTELS